MFTFKNIKMTKLEQKIIKENYEKIDDFMGFEIYKKGHHRIILRQGKNPIEYFFNKTKANCEKYLKVIYKK